MSRTTEKADTLDSEKVTEEPVDTDVEPDADSDTEAAAPVEKAEPRRNQLVYGALALAVITFATAVWFGIAWLRAASDDALEVARTRDEVVRVTDATMTTLKTIDYRSIDDTMARIGNALAPQALQEFLATRDQYKAALVEKKVITEADVPDNGVAIKELNVHEGKASVLVLVNTTRKPEGKPAEQPEGERFLINMERTDSGWKTSGFDPLQVLTSGQ